MKQQVGGQLMGVVLDLRNDPGGRCGTILKVPSGMAFDAHEFLQVALAESGTEGAA
jgi:C-terminal processing protease CtpA/Prc